MDGQLRIDSMYAFVQVDVDGTEGVIAWRDPRTGDMMPLVGADLARVASLRPYAQATATATGRPVQLVHFSRRTDGEVFTP